jgi:predicted O-linked N-acetylglucosamine transferase (SPINDLY family)
MNSQIQLMLQQAIQAFQRKNFDGADLLLKKILQIDSKNFLALNILGLIKASQSKYRDAADFLAKAARIQPNDASLQYNLAKALSDSGDDKDALPHHKKAVTLASNNPKAWLNYGLSMSNLGHFDEALAHYDKALSLKPDYAEAWSNKGIILNKLNRFDEALAHYDKALSLMPDCAVAWAWFNKGIVLNKLNRFDEALAHYDKAISLKPDYAEAWFNKGNIVSGLNRFDEALAHYDKAISLKPDYAEAWSNKGNIVSGLNRFDEALAHYDKALSLKPDYADAWSNKGIALHKLSRFDEALAHYDKALSLKPDYAEAWSNKGNIVSGLNRFDEALVHYDKAISLKPDYAEAWFNKGIVFHKLNRFDEALAHYDKALSLKPDYAEAWIYKGNVASGLNRFDEALAHYDKALTLKPDIDWGYGTLVHTKMRTCNWSDFLDSLEIISKKLMANEKVVYPFMMLALSDNAALHKKSSKVYVQSSYPFNPDLGPILNHRKNEKIRVGYFSADFRNHAVSILTAELFELHDKNKFEIIAFSFGDDDKSPMRSRLSQAFNQFIDVSGMSDLDIAKLSRELCIDIAVDLGGYTDHSRTGIFSYQAAPLQINYIGYLGTTCAEYFDYLLADKTIVPERLRKFYSEKIAYLPCYQANDRKRIISDKQFTRKELSLPDTGFIFCCFNNNYKILSSTFDGWMRILKAVEGSVLFLYAESQWVESNLKKEAEARGINSARLVFGGHMPKEEYLARYQTCDLFLDTFPYNAGTTGSDALWAGLPILTLTGESFASRMAASLLNAIDLPELITSTQEEYEALAIELGLNPNKLADIKLKLANNRLTTPLFDTPLFAKNIEAAYIKMMERYQADLEPDHIVII